MERSEVEKYCKAFLKEQYNIDLYIPVKFNSRLTRTLGVFYYNAEKKTPSRLEFSKKFMENGKKEDIIKVIKHECIHFALFMLGKPFKDGDPYFESEIIKHDSIETDAVIFSIERNVRVYLCGCREHVFLSLISSKICTRCRQPLVYSEKRKQLV